MLLAPAFALLLCPAQAEIHVSNVAELRAAAAGAKPGTNILLKSGEYPGGLHFSALHGSLGKPITIRAADPSHRPTILGGVSGLQLSNVTHLVLRDLVIKGARGNGLNIDDGGAMDTPSHHILLKNLHVTDLPTGNHDGIKLSGVVDFEVEDCVVERWGGSAIDRVGRRRGVVANCTFRSGGDNGVQAKGGSAEVTIRGCRFEQSGQRGVNLGGSTGLQFFRPELNSIPAGQRYEARSLTVEGCTFIGGVCAVAFVGVDGATVRFNTIIDPTKWALRILQETRLPDFVPCRMGVFESNLIAFRSTNWSAGGVNIGPGTAPETFRFQRNFWFCSDRPSASTPNLPTREMDGKIGQDPGFRNPEAGDYRVGPGSKATGVGAHAFKPRQ